ncbi:MAG: nucleoside triphosphate pyrophosphatase [Candidatus Nanopelagicales bacterium]
MHVILASASPARLSVLRAAGLHPEVVVSGIDESGVAGKPADVVQTLAERKAMAVAETWRATHQADDDRDAVVIGCDSLLDFNGQAFGKPNDDDETVARWKLMRDQVGVLHTGHCLVRTDDGRRASAVASTEVTFGHPTDAEIDAYAATGEPLRVAGSFTIDGYGGWFIDHLSGDHGTVLGLSLPLTRTLLTTLDIPLTTLW